MQDKFSGKFKKITVTLLLPIIIIFPSFCFSQDIEQYGKAFTGVPSTQDAVVYQVNMRAFSKDGHFQGVTNRLDNIKALGVNVIYLMPIYPVGILKGINSPYAIRDYQAIAKEFGTLKDLRALVEGAHKRDMAVILDFVANHTAWDHPWVSDHNDWYEKDDDGKLVSPHGWMDIVQLNFNKKAVNDALIDSMRYWVFTANIDGFRFDYAGGPPVDFWKEVVVSLRSIDTHDLLLLAEDTRSENFTVGLDYNFGFSFFEELHKVFEGESAQLLDQLYPQEYNLANEDQRVVRYTTNHDVNASHGTPEFLFGGERGAMAAFVITTYMRSTPMIYNGQEVGTPEPIAFPFTKDTIDWTINPDKTREYSDIIRVFNGNKVLRHGSLQRHSSHDLVAFTRTTATEQAFVISNPRNTEIHYKLPVEISNKTWTDAFTGKKVQLGSTLPIPSHAYRTFITTEFTPRLR